MPGNSNAVSSTVAALSSPSSPPVHQEKYKVFTEGFQDFEKRKKTLKRYKSSKSP
jgi:hypothetical protein